MRSIKASALRQLATLTAQQWQSQALAPLPVYARHFNATANVKHADKPTVFDKLGGKAAVKAAVDIFYNKVVADERVNSYFKDVDMAKQRAKQMQFMTYAFGGPEAYKGKDLWEAHKHMGLSEMHFNAICENFVETLKELNVPQDIIDEAAGVVLTTKPMILGPAAK